MKRTKLECSREELFDVNMMITFSVSVNGDPVRAQLEDAFRQIVRAHEILNTRIVIEENGEAFYEEWGDPQSSISYTTLTLTELIHQQEKIRFRVEEGEFLRLFVNDATPGTTELHFFMHHTAGDGKAFCFLIERFFKCLDGENPDYDSILLMSGRDFPENGRIRLLEKYIAFLNRRWKKEKHIFSFEESAKAFDNFWACHESNPEFEEIEKDRLDPLLAECHKRHITFTSYCTAKLLAESGEEKTIGFAMDIRDPGNRHMGNYAAGIPFTCKYNDKLDIWQNAEKINVLLKKKMNSPKTKYLALNLMLNLDPSLVDAINMESAGYFHSSASGRLVKILGYGRGKPFNETGFSNLGVYNIKTEYGSFSIQSVKIIPPNVSYLRNVVGLITAGGRLCVSRSSYRQGE